MKLPFLFLIFNFAFLIGSPAQPILRNPATTNIQPNVWADIATLATNSVTAKKAGLATNDSYGNKIVADPAQGYLFSSFLGNNVALKGTSGNSPVGFLSYSGNGTNFSLISQPNLAPLSQVRDSSIIVFSNLVFWAFTARDFSATNSFGLSISRDWGLTWSTCYIALTNIGGQLQATQLIKTAWAPELFTNLNGGLEIMVAADTNASAGGAGGVICELHPTDSTFTNWSSPIYMSGLANGYDPCMTISNNTYFVLMKAGGLGASLYASTSLTTNYSAQQTSATWLGYNTIALEGWSVVNFGDGRLRIYGVTSDATWPAAYWYLDTTNWFSGTFSGTNYVTTKLPPGHGTFYYSPYSAFIASNIKISGDDANLDAMALGTNSFNLNGGIIQNTRGAAAGIQYGNNANRAFNVINENTAPLLGYSDFMPNDSTHDYVNVIGGSGLGSFIKFGKYQDNKGGVGYDDNNNTWMGGDAGSLLFYTGKQNNSSDYATSGTVRMAVNSTTISTTNGTVFTGNASGITNATTSYFTNLVNGNTNVNTLTRTVQWTIPVAVSSPAATLGSAEIDAQIQRSDGVWITVDDLDIAGGATSILATNKESLVVIVPSGASMRVTNSTSGTGYVAGLDATKTNTFTVFP